MKSPHFLGLIALAAVGLQGQPTTGAQYWSTTVPYCGNLGGPVAITNSAGVTIGASCVVSGTFAWLAAGGGWTSSIRIGAPAAGAIGVDYTFYDTEGKALSLDTVDSSSTTASGNDVNFALYANQASEIRLLGAGGDAQHSNVSTGSVYVVIYCPNLTACQTVLPQLIYSNSSPLYPWALSVPVSWDASFSQVQPTGVWTQWSAVGLNDPSRAALISLVICNQNNVASIYTIRVYDSTGALVGQAATQSIPGFDSVTKQGGTRGFLLTDVIRTPLPNGIIKITVDGGSNYSSAAFLQFTGASATSLQVAFDTTSGASASAPTAEFAPQNSGRARPPAKVFRTLPK